ncbi:MAG: hypothetical protein PW789_18260 [Edaphobacter sp.]|uniref:hypothetical protein n=1 Tax=Edaphobacter sp. TaxID=1934404 RepID=UPI00238E3CD8|nr:hypothetical protein [Edaphobacter sp.]MDE1178521.1 hypothetical protein [Edaphobacter sp.]
MAGALQSLIRLEPDDLACGCAGADLPPSQPLKASDAVTVTTSIPPIPLSESNRSVVTMDTREQPLLYNNVTDYMRQDTSLNLQSRAANGVQADLSILRYDV